MHTIARHRRSIVKLVLVVSLLVLVLFACGKPEIGQIEVTPADKTISVGETTKFDAVVLSTDGETMPDISVDWRVEGDGDIGTIDSRGVFTAQKPGDATVTASADGVTQKVKVVVSPASIANLELTPERSETLPEQTVTFTASATTTDNKPAGYNKISLGTPTDGAKISEKSLILDPSGKARFELIAPSKPGKVTITASSNGIETTADITVVPPPVAKIEIQPSAERNLADSAVSVAVKGFTENGGPATFSPITISASTPGTEVSSQTITLDENGESSFKVTLSPQPGQNRILIASNGMKQEMTIEGTQISRLEILPDQTEFEIGQKVDFTAKGYDSYGNNREVKASWSLTGNSSKLKADGNVVMQKQGSGIVFAKYKNLRQGQPFQIVPGNPSKITIEPQKAQLKAGQRLSFKAEVFNAYGHPLSVDVAWQVKGGRGSVGPKGVFQAETAGEGQVIASSGKASASADVSVSHGPLADIVIQLKENTFTAGKEIQLAAEGVDAYGNRFSVAPKWFLDKSLGTIDQQASVFKPLNVGNGKIIAKIGDVLKGIPITVVPAKASLLEIEPSSVNLIAGDTVQFKVTAYDPYGNKVAVEPNFTIGEPLGDMSTNGSFKARKAGNTVIHASARDLSAKGTVAVAPAEMTAIRLSPEGPIELVAGSTQRLDASGYDEFGNIVQARVKWQMHPDLGTIDEQGILHPKKAGKANIFATVDQERTGKVMEAGTSLLVKPGQTTRIEVNPKSVQIEAGEDLIFSATAYDQFGNNTYVDLNWALENPALGTITKDGRFSAVTAASGKVTAEYENAAGSADVQVVPSSVSFLKIIPEQIQAHAGEKIQLEPIMEDRFGNVANAPIQWKLSDDTLATISDDNLFIAQKSGSGKLIAAVHGIAATAPVQVQKGSLEKIQIQPAETTLASGETVGFKAIGLDAGGNPIAVDFEWSVDPEIVRINETGIMTAVKTGTARVTVSHGDVKQTALVNVKPGKPASMTLKPEQMTITAGETKSISIEVHDVNGNRIPSPDVSAQVENELGSIMPKGIFKANKAGQGVVKFTAGDATGKIDVKVAPGPVHTVVVEPDRLQLAAGDHRKFSAAGYDSQGNRLNIETQWVSSGGIGDIDQNDGTFKATTVGRGFVTARMDKATGVAEIQVVPGPVDSINVTPKNSKMRAGSNMMYSATPLDAYGNRKTARIDWSVKGDKDLGSISQNGRFTAKKAGTGQIVASAKDVQGSAELFVEPAALQQLMLSPDSIVLKAGEKLDIDTIGKDKFGNEVSVSPTYSVRPGSLGSVGMGGIFTAAKEGSGQLIASVGDIQKSIPVQVHSGSLKQLEIKSPEKALKAGNTYQFYAVGYDPGGNVIPADVEWAVTQNVGRIESNTGEFQAGTAGDGLVFATSGNISAAKQISVEPGELYSLFIEPNPVTVQAGTSQKFEPNGLDIEENSVAVSSSSADWDVVGGIGTFEAPGVFRGTKMGKGKVSAQIGSLMAESYVTVVPGAPDTKESRIRVTYPILPADGESYTEVILEVRDTNNNPVPGIEATIVSNRQADKIVQPKETEKDGISRGRVQSNVPGTSVIRAVVNGSTLLDTAKITFK